MNLSPSAFRDRLLDDALGFLWTEWSMLGVPGYTCQSQDWFIDPDALLAFTCTIGRYDARLFDAVLDWMCENGRYVNVKRFRGMFKNRGFAGQRVADAIIATMRQHTPSAKWRIVRESAPAYGAAEPLFYFAAGKPLPVPGERDPVFQDWGLIRNPVQLRRNTKPFPYDRSSAFLLRLRAFLGVGARCEILAYLLCKGPGHSYGIARATGYFQKTVYDALADMERSGLVVSSRSGRERTYKVNSPDLARALLRGERRPQWIDWPRSLAAVERLWLQLDHIRTGHETEEDRFIACRVAVGEYNDTLAGLDIGTHFPFEWIHSLA